MLQTVGGMGKLPQISLKIWWCPHSPTSRNQTVWHMKTGKYSFERGIIALHLVKKIPSSVALSWQYFWRSTASLSWWSSSSVYSMIPSCGFGCNSWVDWVVVLHPTPHKIGHFGDVSKASLLAWYGKKLNLTQQKHAFVDQKKMCYNTK